VRAGPAVLEFSKLDSLFDALGAQGFRIIGPAVREGAVVLDELRRAADLPVGWRDDQQPARYRLQADNSGAAFAWTAGPHSWKRYLHPLRLVLWRARRDEGGFAITQGPEAPERYAFFGVRPCDLAAIAVLDRALAADPVYAARRASAFVVAVNCTTPGGTCFCASLGTGPEAAAGHDLVLTELLHEGHLFVVEAGSSRGAEMLAALPTRVATEAETQAKASALSAAAAGMGRPLETRGLKEALAASLEHPRWDDVAQRCLACGNCTLVCPTCFCTTVEDTTDLAGDEAVRARRWSSCFGVDFSYIHGGSLRASTRARYRQWLTHKLSTWHDQFGTAGCVGCGRCITWCPAGIDITEEVRAIREAPPPRSAP
jgi:sulfhydrogenase subunit beta (sulfur reductase)